MSAAKSTPKERWTESLKWRDDAACLDEDPELFFPIGAKEPAQFQIEEAKQVCSRCDVRGACLLWALQVGEQYGVWGGLSEDERRGLRGRSPSRPKDGDYVTAA